MPNAIKYSTSPETLALKKGNFWIGTGDVGKGPTEVTGYWNGITPPSSGYTVYTNKETQGPSIRVPNNDDELLNVVNSLDRWKNYARPLNLWDVRRSDIVEITDGSIAPPFPGARVWRCTVNNSAYPNTLHRMWGNGNLNGIVGTLGSFRYRYYMWVRGAATNNPTSIVEIDISDGGGRARSSQTIGTSENWTLFSTIDQSGTNYNSFKWFDMNFGSQSVGNNGDIFYVSSIHVVSVDTSDPSELISQQNMPFPGYIDYFVTKPLILENKTQCLIYGSEKNSVLISNKDYEEIITDGLVLNLDAGFTPSYPTSGTTWYDLGPNVNNGTLINGPTFSSDNGGSIVFDGVDDYVDGIGGISTFSFIQNTGIFTISAWVKLTNLSGARYFLGNNDGTTGLKGFYLGHTGASGRLWLSITYGVSGQATINLIRNDFFLNNNWVFVTAIGNGTSAQFYRNGQIFSIPGIIGTLSTEDSSRTLAVGRINNFNSSYWQGNVANVQIYNRTLSSEEILQNYNAQKSRFEL
jgi:hypothetical protein